MFADTLHLFVQRVLIHQLCVLCNRWNYQRYIDYTKCRGDTEVKMVDEMYQGVRDQILQ